MNTLQKLIIACIVLGLLVGNGLAAGEASKQGPSPIKIGVISGLTGMAGKWNRFQNMGITLAKEELDAAGTKIDLVIEDSRSLSPSAILAFNKLIDFDRVNAIIGDDFGFVLAPLIPMVKQREVAFITLWLPHEKNCRIAPGYFYSIASQFSQSRKAFELFFDKHPDIKKIALVVFDDQEWGLTYHEIWKDIAKQRNVEIVSSFLSTESNPDFKSALTKILAKKPQAIFVAHEPEGFMKSLSSLKYEGMVVFANNVLEMLADSPEPRRELEGVFVVDPNISMDFYKKFFSRFGRPPILEAYAGYEALHALAKAFKINSKHPGQGMKQVSYNGVAGKIDFTGRSCAGNQANWGLYRFQNGEMQRQD